MLVVSESRVSPCASWQGRHAEFMPDLLPHVLPMANGPVSEVTRYL